MKKEYQVIIIGAGPAGIGAARALQKNGISDFIVIDREEKIGGVPRHCLHPSFGLLTFYRPLSGPTFIRKISANLNKESFITKASVTHIDKNGAIKISTNEGVHTLIGKRIILATGARETPRHPRLISGLRPQGVLTTGALQQMIYLKGQKPCQNPVIIGSELVSFSALWTLRSHGIHIRAMIEQNARPSVWRICNLLPMTLGTKVMASTKIASIGGLERVEYVDLENTQSGKKERIACDAVIFTGKFVGENTLVRHSHLAQNAQTGVPITDQFGRCSDDLYFATGNMLHPAETGEQCFAEGLLVGKNVANCLAGKLPKAAQIVPIVLKDARLRVVYPAQIALHQAREISLNFRTNAHFCGEIVVRLGEEVIHRQTKNCLAEQGFALKNMRLPEKIAAQIPLNISITANN